MRYRLFGLPIRARDGVWEGDSDNPVVRALIGITARVMLKAVVFAEWLTGTEIPVRPVYVGPLQPTGVLEA